MSVDSGSPSGMTKREFVRKATYVVPAVLTLAAAPSFASAGSNSKKAKKPKDFYTNYRKGPRKKS